MAYEEPEGAAGEIRASFGRHYPGGHSYVRRGVREEGKKRGADTWDGERR